MNFDIIHSQQVDVCANSVLSGVCQIKGGSIKKSVLTQVAAVEVTIENALLCNVTAKSIKAAKNSVCYNVVSDGDIVLAEGEVLVGVTRPGEEQLVRFFVFKLLSYFVKNVKKKNAGMRLSLKLFA